MENDERQYIITTLMKLPLRAFYGTLDDLTQLQCLYGTDGESFTKKEDEFLNKLYGAHVQVIGECFTCFGKEKPMRLIKLDEETIRIICDPCRENLHSAKSN
jgi:hypothetical protein